MNPQLKNRHRPEPGKRETRDRHLLLEIKLIETRLKITTVQESTGNNLRRVHFVLEIFRIIEIFMKNQNWSDVDIFCDLELRCCFIEEVYPNIDFIL